MKNIFLALSFKFFVSDVISKIGFWLFLAHARLVFLFVVILQLMLTLFSKHKLSVKELLYAEVSDTPVRLLQSASNIPTSHI